MKWLLMMVLVLSVSNTQVKKSAEQKFVKHINAIVQPLDSISAKLDGISKKIKDL